MKKTKPQKSYEKPIKLNMPLDEEIKKDKQN